jgi:hypothetical protein
MGYASLDAALAFPNNLPPVSTHIAITDSLKSDANFLIHHFIVNHLKADKPVVLVGLSQIFNHYFLIGRKLVCYNMNELRKRRITIEFFRVSIYKHINNQVNSSL